MPHVWFLAIGIDFSPEIISDYLWLIFSHTARSTAAMAASVWLVQVQLDNLPEVRVPRLLLISHTLLQTCLE